MIVTSNTEKAKWALYLFLKEKDIVTSRSEDFQAIGILDPKELALKAVVGYNSFCRRTCSMHVAGEGIWLTRELIRVCFEYPFKQLHLVQVFAPIAASNERALKLVKKLGFQRFAIIPKGWDDETDLVIHSMTEKDCRWLRQENEKMAA